MMRRCSPWSDFHPRADSTCIRPRNARGIDAQFVKDGGVLLQQFAVHGVEKVLLVWRHVALTRVNNVHWDAVQHVAARRKELSRPARTVRQVVAFVRVMDEHCTATVAFFVVATRQFACEIAAARHGAVVIAHLFVSAVGASATRIQIIIRAIVENWPTPPGIWIIAIDLCNTLFTNAIKFANLTDTQIQKNKNDFFWIFSTNFNQQ